MVKKARLLQTAVGADFAEHLATVLKVDESAFRILGTYLDPSKSDEERDEAVSRFVVAVKLTHEELRRVLNVLRWLRNRILDGDLSNDTIEKELTEYCVTNKLDAPSHKIHAIIELVGFRDEWLRERLRLKYSRAVVDTVSELSWVCDVRPVLSDDDHKRVLDVVPIVLLQIERESDKNGGIRLQFTSENLRDFISSLEEANKVLNKLAESSKDIQKIISERSSISKK